jgi:hypothetical protein
MSDDPARVSDAEKRTELTRIATELHDIDVGDPLLDTSSPNFGLYTWTKAILRAADEVFVKFWRASFASKDLVMFGSGIAMCFQPNVASVIMAPF